MPCSSPRADKCSRAYLGGFSVLGALSLSVAQVFSVHLAQLVVEGLELLSTAAAPGKLSHDLAHLVHALGVVAQVEVGELFLQLKGALQGVLGAP
jgi:hypothetical protein